MSVLHIIAVLMSLGWLVVGVYLMTSSNPITQFIGSLLTIFGCLLHSLATDD